MGGFFHDLRRFRRRHSKLPKPGQQINTDYLHRPAIGTVSKNNSAPIGDEPPKYRFQDASVNNLDLLEWQRFPSTPPLLDGDSNKNAIVTSATMSRLGELDRLYPEAKDEYRFFQQNDAYNFLIRRHGSSSDFAYYNEGKFFSLESDLSSDSEVLEVEGNTFRLFERIARGSAVMISCSCLDYQVRLLQEYINESSQIKHSQPERLDVKRIELSEPLGLV